MASADAGDTPATADPGYALSSSSEDEHARLSRQSAAHEPFTHRLLERAESTRMRVLDVGCGPGDVSFLLSELVGAEGSVVGVERDEQAVATARRRAEGAGLGNVECVCGDFRDVQLDGAPFDALVGRFVLMYQADPADAVRKAASHLRPGGIAAFLEANMIGSAVPARWLGLYPATAASEQLSGWIYEAFARLGTQPDMGGRLPHTFAEAGLEPSPDVDAGVAVAVGEDAISHTVEFAAGLLPAIIAAGIATEEEVNIDHLAERLRADSGPVGPVVWPTAFGAFATKPPEA